MTVLFFFVKLKDNMKQMKGRLDVMTAFRSLNWPPNALKLNKPCKSSPCGVNINRCAAVKYTYTVESIYNLQHEVKKNAAL